MKINIQIFFIFFALCYNIFKSLLFTLEKKCKTIHNGTSFNILFAGLSIIFFCKSHTNLQLRLNGKIKGKFWEIFHFVLGFLPIIIFILIVKIDGFVEKPAIILPLVVYSILYYKEIKNFKNK